MANFDQVSKWVALDPNPFFEALGARRNGKGWHCPLPDQHRNGDRDPSFGGSNVRGRFVLNCSCGLAGTPVQVASEVWGVGEYGAGERLAELYDIPTTRKRAIADAYPYTDEDGELLYEVVRLEPKAFRLRRPDGDGGWIWGLDGVRRVLYRLPEVVAAVQAGERVYVAEGEKDADALEERGVVATTIAGGAGAPWDESYTGALRGAQVVIVADRDRAGRSHAWQLATRLEGVAADIRVVEPATGKDAADHVAAGFALDVLIPAQKLAAQVPLSLATDRRLPDATRALDVAVYHAIAALGPQIGLEDIARVVGRGDRSVKRSRKRLRNAGWLRWRRCRRTASVYRLRVPRRYR